MANMGNFADGRTYELPKDWDPLPQEVLEAAHGKAREALDIGPGLSRPAFERLAEYYDPESNYAGATFATVEPNEAMYVGAADLWAVGTLSMQRFMTPLLGRRLLDAGTCSTNVTRQLRRLPTDLPITDVDADVLATMYELHATLRGVMSDGVRASNWWVFASKLCARKRPLLFPVRDNLVCEFLAAGNGVGRGPGQLGQFDRDIQVFAYLMTAKDIRFRIAELLDQFEKERPGSNVDVHDLRILDAALWTAAQLQAPGPKSHEAPDEP